MNVSADIPPPDAPRRPDPGRLPDAQSACPFLDAGDDRCQDRFRLPALAQAFQACFDRPHTCPVYRTRTREQRALELQPLTISIQGRTLDGYAATAAERLAWRAPGVGEPGPDRLRREDHELDTPAA